MEQYKVCTNRSKRSSIKAQVTKGPGSKGKFLASILEFILHFFCVGRDPIWFGTGGVSCVQSIVKSHVTEQQSTAELEWAHWVAATVVGSSSNAINWDALEKRCISKKYLSWADIHTGLLIFKIHHKVEVWVVGNMDDLNNIAQTAEGQKIEYLESACLGQGFIFLSTEFFFI